MSRIRSGTLWIATVMMASTLRCLAEAQVIGAPTPGIPGFVPCTYPLFAAPIAMTVADFNHDGNPDLAVIDSSDSHVNVLITTASDFAQGNCLGAVSLTTFDLPSGSGAAKGIATGILDPQKGSYDLAIAVSNGVVVAHGKGDGSFSPVDPPLPAGVGPQAVAIADVDGDGRPDIVVADGNGNSVSILYGSSSGLQPFVSLPVKGPVTSLVVEDLNKDSFVDIAAVSPNPISGTTGQVFVFLQDPSAPRNFHELPGVSVGVSPRAVMAGDFNDDGTPDLAVASGGASGKLGIFLSQLPQNETIPFVQKSLVDTGMLPGTNPSALGVDDFNRDGLLDVVVANQGDNSVPFFLGDGKGDMTSVPGNCGGANNECVVGVAPAALALADVDGDGRADVITADQGGVSLTFLLSSQPGPTPSPKPTITPTPSATSTFLPSPTPTFGGDCCKFHDGPGCCVPNPPTTPTSQCPASDCETCVSSVSGFCHTDQWDDLCVQIANEQCASTCLCGVGTMTPTPTNSPSITPTPQPTQTATMTRTGSLPPTATATRTPTATPTGPTAVPTRTINSTNTPTPTAVFTNTATNTSTPGVQGTPTPQCFAAGVCISGSGCSVVLGERRTGDIGGWLLPLAPLLMLWRRRVR